MYDLTSLANGFTREPLALNHSDGRRRNCIRCSLLDPSRHLAVSCSGLAADRQRRGDTRQSHRSEWVQSVITMIQAQSQAEASTSQISLSARYGKQDTTTVFLLHRVSRHLCPLLRRIWRRRQGGQRMAGLSVLIHLRICSSTRIQAR